jgi:hypothetical protein
MKNALLVCAGSLVAAAAVAADLSGTWKIDSSVGDAPVVVQCTLAQAGNALSGSCRPQVDGIPPSDLVGVVDGSRAKWGYDVVFNDNPGRVDYEAVIEEAPLAVLARGTLVEAAGQLFHLFRDGLDYAFSCCTDVSMRRSGASYSDLMHPNPSAGSCTPKAHQPAYESLQGSGSWPSSTPRRCQVMHC